MTRFVRPIVLLALFALGACHVDDLSPGYADSGDEWGGDGDGGWGATPGGAQDIGFARQEIAAGRVPPADAIPTEGLLSEHDLPPGGPACDSLLCVQPALAIGPNLATGEFAHWVHVGMASGLPRDFERPPLDVVIAIDKSGSMSVDMEETITAATNLIGRLREDDRVGVISFDTDVTVHRDLGPVANREELVAQLRRIEAGGGWELERATRAGFEMFDAVGSDDERLQRLMVFSCGYPALSAGGDDSYSELVHGYADRGVGMSFFGILLGYDPTLSGLMADARGGAYFFLNDLERIEQLFVDEIDTMVTPLAYDMALSLAIGDGFELLELFGRPGDFSGEPVAEFNISTAFLSKRRGAATIARLARADEALSNDVGSVSLSYTPELALGWDEAETQEVAIRARGDGEPYYETLGVRKAVALVNQAQQMRAACDLYHANDAVGAIALLNELRDYLAAESATIDDDGLRTELALVEQLISNME